MNWKNIDLHSNYERNLNLLENYTFETFLLEIYTNIRTEDLNETELKKHFEKEIQNKVREAKEIFESNLTNLLNYAKNEREEN